MDLHIFVQMPLKQVIICIVADDSSSELMISAAKREINYTLTKRYDCQTRKDESRKSQSIVNFNVFFLSRLYA